MLFSINRSVDITGNYCARVDNAYKIKSDLRNLLDYNLIASAFGSRP